MEIPFFIGTWSGTGVYGMALHAVLCCLATTAELATSYESARN
jgi:hypothetical protein